MIRPTITRYLARLLAVAVISLPLAACGDSGSSQGDDRTASGEVLQGSISDEMLPLDQVTSQPPPLKSKSASSPGGDSDVAEDVEGAEGGDAPGDAPPIATEPGSSE